MSRPTTEEIRHWHARLGFASKVSAAASLGISVALYKKWYYGEKHPSASVRRLMQYIERFGKWEQIQKLSHEQILEWRNKLPASADTEAAQKRSEHFTKLRQLQTQRKGVKSSPGSQ